MTLEKLQSYTYGIYHVFLLSDHKNRLMLNAYNSRYSTDAHFFKKSGFCHQETKSY